MRPRRRGPRAGEAPLAGLLLSRPVSRILSRVTIHLVQLPGPSAGRLNGTCSPCTGRGLASRRVATTLVGSYPTVSPLPAASPETRRRRFAFCATFRRLSPPGSRQRPALRCPDFPRAARCARAAVTRPAASNSSPALQRPLGAELASRTPGRRRAAPPCMHELAADRALERGAAQQREQLLLERPVQGRDVPTSSELPEDPHDLAENLHVVRVDRLERGVLRLEPDAPLLPVERLDGRLVGASRRRRRARRRSRRCARPARAGRRRCRRRGCRPRSSTRP